MIKSRVENVGFTVKQRGQIKENFLKVSKLLSSFLKFVILRHGLF